MRTRAAAFAAGAALLALAACSARTPAGVAAGERFPATTLPALFDGEPALVLPRGEPLVVNVWATWCEPCRREMASLQALHQRAPQGVRVVGVSIDTDRFLAQEFVRKLGLAFPNALADADALTRGALAVRAYPTTFVIGADGVVRWRHEGPRDWASAETAAQLARVLRP